jgi:PEP-CTERM motif
MKTNTLRALFTVGAALIASNSFAQTKAPLLFDLSTFVSQSSANMNSTSGGLMSGITFQTWNGTAMETVKGGAGLLKAQFGKSGQTTFDTSRNDWFYTLCVEPTAWLVNGATNDIGTTKDFTQPFKTPSDPKAADSLALLYHNYGNRNAADPSSSLVANTLGEQVGLQVAFWEIVNDFDSTKSGLGLDLSKGLFNFQLSYADGSVNRQEVIDSANRYLSYTKETLLSGKDISGYQAEFFHVNNTVDANGNRRGQDVVGGKSIPEPGTLALGALGLVALVARRRRK